MLMDGDGGRLMHCAHGMRSGRRQNGDVGVCTLALLPQAGKSSLSSADFSWSGC